jgi:hypothetical protein
MKSSAPFSVNDIFSISKEQFEAATTLTRMLPTSDNYLVAKDILVNGVDFYSAIEKHGMYYQNAWTTIRKIRDNLELCKVAAGINQPQGKKARAKK